VAFQWQLLQYLAQPLDALLRVQLAGESRQLGELFLHQRIIDVERGSILALVAGVLLGEVAGDRVQVGLGMRMAVMSATRSMRR